MLVVSEPCIIISFDQIDSTNRVAKEFVLEGKASGTVVHAVMQTAGRGQNGRSFNSPPGGLYFSLLLQPDLRLEFLPLVTLATGLACRDVLASSFAISPLIKWPNDIYVGDRKIAGILCENVAQPCVDTTSPMVVIGVGLNVNNSVDDFSPDVRSIITTLYDLISIKVDLNSLLTVLVSAIIKNVSTLGPDPQEILTRWQRYDYLKCKAVIYTTGARSMQGTGLGLSPEGYYRINDDQGIEHSILGGQLRPLL